MTPKDILDGLQELRRSLRPILHDSSEMVLEEAAARIRTQLRKQSGRSRRAPRDRWGYVISHDAPLRFQPTTVEEIRLWVDLYCTVLWEEEGELPVEQVIQLRVWSDEHSFLQPYELEAMEREDAALEEHHREARRAVEKMTDPIDPGRVIFRCHFDKANVGQPGPLYHLQFGGESQAGEFCWLPRIISVPRFIYAPMDLILTCEMIAANFYWDTYDDIRKDPNWKSVISQSQQNLITDYYRGCLESLEGRHHEESGSLLDHLWNN